MTTQQVFYVSRSRAEFDGVARILATARRRNSQYGVTGALLFTGRYFAQVLEGDQKLLAPLLAQIGADSRHEGMRVLRSASLSQPQFAAWSMAYCELPGVEDLLGHLLESSMVDAARAERLVALIFRQCAAAPTVIPPQAGSSDALNS